MSAPAVPSVQTQIDMIRESINRGERLGYDQQKRTFVVLTGKEAPLAPPITSDSRQIAAGIQNLVDQNPAKSDELVPLLTDYLNRLSVQESSPAAASSAQLAQLAQAAPSMKQQLEEIFNKKLLWSALSPALKGRLSKELVLEWLEKCARDVKYPHLIVNCINYLTETHPDDLKRLPFPLFQLCQRELESHDIGDLTMHFSGRQSADRVNSALVSLRCPQFTHPAVQESFLSSPVGRDALIFLLSGKLQLNRENFRAYAELGKKAFAFELLRAVDQWAQDNLTIDDANFQNLWQLARDCNLPKLLGRMSDWLLEWAHPTSANLGKWPLTSQKMDFLVANRAHICSIDFNKIPFAIAMEALKNYPNLHRVTLSPTMSSEQIATLFRTYPKLESVIAAANRNIGFRELNLLQRSSLTCLDLRGCPNIMSGSISRLWDFERLAELRLGNRGTLDPEALRALARCTHLDTLEISNTPRISAAHIQEIKRIPCLRALILDSDSDLQDTALTELEMHPTLQEVSCNGCESLTNAALASCARIPKLGTLSARNLPLISSEGMQALIDAKYISKIDIRGCRSIIWHQVHLIPGSWKKTILFESKEIPVLPWSDQLPKILSAHFRSRFNSINSTQNFEPFVVNGATYYAWGPKSYLDEKGRRVEQLDTFYKELYSSVQPTWIVNLMSTEKHPQEAAELPAEALPYVNSTAFTELFSIEREGGNGEQNIYSKKGTSGVMQYHIRKWLDTTAPSKSTIVKLLELANNIHAQRKASSDFRLFVHCRRGLMRTAFFIALCELVRMVGAKPATSAAECRAFLLRTLEQIQDRERDRFPQEVQLQLLFSDEFLDTVRETFNNARP